MIDMNFDGLSDSAILNQITDGLEELYAGGRKGTDRSTAEDGREYLTIASGAYNDAPTAAREFLAAFASAFPVTSERINWRMKPRLERDQRFDTKKQVVTIWARALTEKAED